MNYEGFPFAEHIMKYFAEKGEKIGSLCVCKVKKGGKHNKPHIHALYGDDEIIVTIDGEILEGSLPNKQIKLLLA